MCFRDAGREQLHPARWPASRLSRKRQRAVSTKLRSSLAQSRIRIRRAASRCDGRAAQGPGWQGRQWRRPRVGGLGHPRWAARRRRCDRTQVNRCNRAARDCRRRATSPRPQPEPEIWPRPALPNTSFALLRSPRLLHCTYTQEVSLTLQTAAAHGKFAPLRPAV